MLQATLGVIIKDGKILLWEKKRWFASWVLNWVWWKLDVLETLEQCIIRETKEEIWLDITEIEYLWILHFYFQNKPERNMSVSIFMLKEYKWKEIETDEVKPFWFDLDKIPYDKMWKDDIYWLPRILAWEKNIEYKFWFDKEMWKIQKYEKIS